MCRSTIICLFCVLWLVLGIILDNCLCDPKLKQDMVKGNSRVHGELMFSYVLFAFLRIFIRAFNRSHVSERMYYLNNSSKSFFFFFFLDQQFLLLFKWKTWIIVYNLFLCFLWFCFLFYEEGQKFWRVLYHISLYVECSLHVSIQSVLSKEVTIKTSLCWETYLRLSQRPPLTLTSKSMMTHSSGRSVLLHCNTVHHCKPLLQHHR